MDGAYSWTSNAGPCDYVVTFVHEIGHGLGAHHDPASAKQPQRAFRPYGFGHGDIDVMPSIGTAVSNLGQIEPFFSTPRIRTWGVAAGIAGARDNERLLRETVHIGARYSDYLRSVEGVPAPPSDLRMMWRDGAFARLSWKGNAPDADGYEVRCFEGSDPLILRVEGRTEATVPLERREPGTVYRCHVLATKGEVPSLRSGFVYLVIPGEPLKAPSDVVVDAGASRLDVHWTDNSDNEIGFDVLLMEDGDPIARAWASADETSVPFSASRVEPQDREYEVTVYATHRTARSESSESATSRWRDHPLVPGPVAALTVTAIGPTTVRVSWTGNPESDSYAVDSRLAGWLHSIWPLQAESVDIEGLARGGRYTFGVYAANEYGQSLPSLAHLTLGSRGAGPRAPSEVYVVESGVHWTTLGWKDNSNDELGFEVQWGGTRSALVPPDTTTTVISSDFVNRRSELRVFAYNERGFSLPGVLGAAPPGGRCEADAETLCLRDSRFEVKMRWRNAAGESGAGRVANAGAKDSGLFYFFDPENWEVLIKVLDGCSVNGRMWVLGASTTDLWYRIDVKDTLMGDSRSYWNEPGQPAPAIVDTEAFPLPCGTAATTGSPFAKPLGGKASRRPAAGARASVPEVAAGRAAERCEAGATTLCLGSGRFAVGIEASTLDGERREGLVARAGTDRSGLFHFFDPENWEVLVKVLDGCAINGHHWVFAASATDMGLDLRVEDAVTGAAKRYGTTAGQPAPAIVDTEALACAAGAVRGGDNA